MTAIFMPLLFLNKKGRLTYSSKVEYKRIFFCPSALLIETDLDASEMSLHKLTTLF